MASPRGQTYSYCMAFNLRCCDDSEHSFVNQRREPAMRIRPLHHILRAWVSGCAAGASIFLSLAKKDCTLLCEMDCAEPGVDFGGAYQLTKPAGREKPCLLFKVALRDGNETRTNCLTFKNCLRCVLGKIQVCLASFCVWLCFGSFPTDDNLRS